MQLVLFYSKIPSSVQFDEVELETDPESVRYNEEL